MTALQSLACGSICGLLVAAPLRLVMGAVDAACGLVALL